MCPHPQIVCPPSCPQVVHLIPGRVLGTGQGKALIALLLIRDFAQLDGPYRKGKYTANSISGPICTSTGNAAAFIHAECKSSLPSTPSRWHVRTRPKQMDRGRVV